MNGEQSINFLTVKQLPPVYIQIKSLFLVSDVGCGIAVVYFVAGALKKVELDGSEPLAVNVVVATSHARMNALL
jgi:hypothetical protein